MSVDGVTLDNVTRRVHFADGAAVALTPVEHNLLRCLMERAGEYVSNDTQLSTMPYHGYAFLP
jgi:DNA-binding response OmpR family regulator